MSKVLIVGNWKMNLNVSQASLLVQRLQEQVRQHRNIEVVITPTMLALQPVSMQIDRRKFRLGAQNAYFKDEGAFTGEVSFTMLRDLVHYVLVGHSERRQYFGEDLPMIRDKVKAAIRNEISPILCIGESQQERKDGETRRVLNDQVTTALADVTAREVMNVVIAYEPVWAIGSGAPARPDQIEEVVQYIRHNVSELYGEKVGNAIRVIYGGSVDPDFVAGILSIDGVDGLLAGGASLVPQKFAGIIEAAHRLQVGVAGDEER